MQSSGYGRWAVGMLAALGLHMMPVSADAQARYPDRTIQMIVPYAAGGTTDLAGRIVAKELGERLGQSVVVENRVGASGSLGVGQALRSPPDGYSMAVSGVSPTMLQHLLGRNLPYDPLKDLKAVGYLGSSGMVFITRKDSNFKTLRQVIDAAKAKSGAITFGSAGVTSPGHLAAEYLSSMASIKMTHVPYAGDSALMVDLMSGRLDIASVGIASVFPMLENGDVLGLGLTSRERLPTLPNLPTVAEAAGLPTYEADIWNLLVLPASTPTEIVNKLNTTVSQMMSEKKVQASLLSLGFTGRPMSLTEIESFITVERDKWGRVLREANIRID